MQNATPENYEFLELLCICKGDSKTPNLNLSHADAYKMACDIFNQKKKKENYMNIITGRLIEPQKVVIYGESGVGKTTLGAQFTKPLIIDAERSSTHLDTPRVFVNTWQNLLATLQECKSCEFETIVIDTIDWAELKCVEHVCGVYKKNGLEDFGYGKGYQYLCEEFIKLLKLADEIINAGKNVVLLAHSQLRKVEPPDEGIPFDRYEPKLSKKCTPLIVEWCDALLFMFRRTYVEESTMGKGKAKGGKKREICANSASFCLAKNRWENLPDEFEANINIILPYLPKTAKTPKEQTPPPDEEKPAVAERTPQQKLSDLLALGKFTEDELLAYLYGKNKRSTAFVAPGTEFNSIPTDLIERMIKPGSWDKIEASLETNRNN